MYYLKCSIVSKMKLMFYIFFFKIFIFLNIDDYWFLSQSEVKVSMQGRLYLCIIAQFKNFEFVSNTLLNKKYWLFLYSCVCLYFVFTCVHCIKINQNWLKYINSKYIEILALLKLWKGVSQNYI